MKAMVYDTGALIAAERGSKAIWQIHARLIENRIAPLVPATALAQAWRGKQVNLQRLLRGCRVVEFTEQDARIAGLLLRESKTNDVVDAHVVLTAQRFGSVIATSDPSDIKRLASAMESSLSIYAI